MYLFFKRKGYIVALAIFLFQVITQKIVLIALILIPYHKLKMKNFIMEEKIMEGKFQKGREKILSKLDFPSDITLDLPKIIVTGDKEITIENHKGILSFESNQIKINSRIGSISINGKEFEILFIGDTTMTISGIFKGISYER